MPKTNAARLLDRQQISYVLKEYVVGDEHLPATEVARQVGMVPESVFKTLLVRGDTHGPCFAVIPATAELDLKALARVSANRKVQMVPLKEVTQLTGYVRGGVTALAPKKAFAVFLDASAGACQVIAVSAGVKGTQIVLKPADYARASAAVVASIVEASGSNGSAAAAETED